MADQKLSALAALAVEMANTDEIYLNDGGVSKRQLYSVFKAAFALVGGAYHDGFSDFVADEHLNWPAAPAGKNVAFASGQGLDFSLTADAAGMTSELFDDYEEGIHVATVTCATSGSYVLSQDELAYTKNGRLVHIQGRLAISDESSPSGQLRISLPYVIATLSGLAGRGMIPINISNHGGTIVNPAAHFVGGLAYAQLVDVTDAGGTSGTALIDETDVDTLFNIYVNFSYVAA